jgi:hypothetical protein
MFGSSGAARPRVAPPAQAPLIGAPGAPSAGAEKAQRPSQFELRGPEEAPLLGAGATGVPGAEAEQAAAPATIAPGAEEEGGAWREEPGSAVSAGGQKRRLSVGPRVSRPGYAHPGYFTPADGPKYTPAGPEALAERREF